LIKRRRFPKIFFGWWTVLGAGFLALWGYAYYAYGISALFKPIASELGFTRAATSVATGIGRLEGGVEGLLAGWITDKFGPRWIVFFGIIIISLSLILMNYINSLWAFYVVWGVMLGLGCNTALSIPLHTAISNWFVKKRGKALSIQSMFSGSSGMIGLPIIAWLIVIRGWRRTCLIGGVIMALIGLPIAWFCLKRHRPEYYGLLPDGTTAEEETAETDQMIDRGVEYAGEVEEVEFTLRQAMRTPAYWLLIAAHAIHGITITGVNIHCIPFLTDIGIDPLVAAGIMTLYVGASVPARLVGGLIADRVRKGHIRFIMAAAYFLQLIGITLFLLNQQSMAMIYVWFILFGIGKGQIAVFAAMVGRYFGRKAYGSIQGSKMMFIAPFSIAAPIYLGWVYDTTGSYITGFVLFTVILALSVVVMSLASPPKPPAQVGDVRKIV